MEFSVVQGDIAEQSAAALVNAAGTSRRMGCGVAGFALEAGVRIICEEIDAYDAESLDDVRVIGYEGDQRKTIQRVADEIRSEA
jgi:O-acetyl-ADP-ribose deacetylase (regulator of RNase III)